MSNSDLFDLWSYEINISNTEYSGLLDVSMYTNLTTLECENNQLTELILSDNLVSLFCSNNKLQRIINYKDCHHCHQYYIIYIVIKINLLNYRFYLMY